MNMPAPVSSGMLTAAENKSSPQDKYGQHSWHHTAVRKVGQLPAPDITISPALAKQLGSSAQHYRNAIMTRQHGLGIAAMAYMRRVVDEKTDELIDIVADLARSSGVSGADVATLLAAKNEVTYKSKLETAKELIPPVLKPSGINPLGQLYKHTSIGLHGKTDDECVSIVDMLKAAFEHIFLTLHQQKQAQQAYVEQMQRLAGN